MLSQEKNNGFEDGSRASVPCREGEAVESRRRVSFTQAEVGRLSRRSVIPSSGD
jgi:hypothetical protein